MTPANSSEQDLPPECAPSGRDPSCSSPLEAVAEACDRRAELHRISDLTGYRLFHGAADGCVGLTIDRVGSLATIEARNYLEAKLPAIAQVLLERTPVTEVAVRGSSSEAAGPHPAQLRSLVGEVPTGSIEIVEHGLHFWVSPNERRESGFFFDTRPARRWLKENSEGRRISNLFAHTGSLGVAAAAGGARSVVHVDNKKSPLVVAREHHARNDLPVDDRSFIVGNVYQQLLRARRGSVELDGIILDPPPVVPRKMAPRKPVGQDYPQLASLAAPLLAPRGWLLCFFSRFDRTRAEYESDVLDHAGVPLEVCWRGTSGEDFPAIDPEGELRLTAFVRV